MSFLQRVFGTDKPDREAQAKEHFGGRNSVFARPTPNADMYREMAQPTATRSYKLPNVLRPGGVLNPGKPPAPQTERQTAANAASAAEQFRLSMGVAPSNNNSSKYLDRQQDVATEQRNANTAAQSNGAWGPYVPMEKPPNSVLQALNEVGFQVNVPEKSAGMPNESFSSTKKLAEHDYRVSSIEDEYLRTAFNQPSVIVGQQGGTIQPPAVPVDTALPIMHMEPTESAALTWDAYESLGDHQKAAVDWNTLLIDAREKDFSDSVKIATPAEQADYDAKVERLFGKEGGSNRYAPNTMNLLDQLDVVQLGQDLDEYLSLERAIDDKQIADFKFSSQDVVTLDQLAGGDKDLQQSYANTRSGDNISALNTANVQAASNLVKTQLTNPNAIPSSFDSLMYGNPSPDGVPLGFGDSINDVQFQEALAFLGTQDITPYGVPADADPLAFVLDNLTEQGADDALKSQFLQYVGQQAQLYSQYGSEEQKTQAALVNKRAGLGG